MGFSLWKSILKYLMQEYYKSILRYIPTLEIQDYLKSAYPDQSWTKDDYDNALRYLIYRKFIEQDIETYRIKTEGKIFYETNQSCIAYFIFMLAMVFIIIAVFGFIYSFTTSRSTSNSSFPTPPQFITVPLTDMVDENSHLVALKKLQVFFDRIPDSQSFDVPFELSADSVVVETGSSNSKNLWHLYLPVDVQGVRKIHLLINLSYTSSNLVNAVKGQAICRVDFIAENGRKEPIELYAGRNLRDWVIGSNDVVKTVSNPVEKVWTAQKLLTKTKAVIDYLILDIPEGMRQERIKKIEIDDRSWKILENTDPGIVIFGITLEK